MPAIEVGEGNTRYCDIDGVLFSKDMNTLVAYPAGGATTYSIPEGVLKIGVSAFEGCSSLKSATFKTKNVEIGGSSFDDCAELETIYLYRNSTADEYFSYEEYTKIYLDDIEFGDASGDNVINAKDMVLLAKSFTGWDVEIDKTAADCNLDDVFDIKDIALLEQYLAGGM